jgi:hypothetical protein
VLCLAALALVLTLIVTSAQAAHNTDRSTATVLQRPPLGGTGHYTAYLPVTFRFYPPVYFDDFDNPATGWPSDGSPICNPHTNELVTKAGKPWMVVEWTRGYVSGEYQIFIPPGNATAVWFCQPIALAPYILNTDVYTVETSARYVDGTYEAWTLNNWWDNLGLIFGANNDGSRLFMLCLGTQRYTDGTRSINWAIFAHTPGAPRIHPGAALTYVFPYRTCAEEHNRVSAWSEKWVNDNGYNHLQAVVNGNNVNIYINGNHGGAWNIPELSDMTRVGVTGGDYEYTPTDVRFDWFKTTLGQ